MIKTIIFDWGGVLIDNPAHELVEYLAHQLDIEHDTFNTHLNNHLQNFQEGRVKEHDLYKKFVDNPLDKGMWKSAVRQCFKDKPKMWNLIKDLRSQDYTTALLSNTEDPTVEHFLEKQYDQYFDVMVFSCQEGISKPNPEIYKRTLKKCDAKPNETIFIDDKKENIEAAQKIGINIIHFKDENKCIAELNNLLGQNP